MIYQFSNPMQRIIDCNCSNKFFVFSKISAVSKLHLRLWLTNSQNQSFIWCFISTLDSESLQILTLSEICQTCNSNDSGKTESNGHFSLCCLSIVESQRIVDCNCGNNISVPDFNRIFCWILLPNLNYVFPVFSLRKVEI